MFRLLAKLVDTQGKTYGYRFVDGKGEVKDLSKLSAIGLVNTNKTTATVNEDTNEIEPVDFSPNRLPIFKNDGSGAGRRSIFIDRIVESDRGKEYWCIDAFGKKRILNRDSVLELLGEGRIVNAKLTSGNVISGILKPIPIMDKKTDKSNNGRSKNSNANEFGQLSLKDSNVAVENKAKRGSEKRMQEKDEMLIRMKKLVPYLSECARVYEQENRELISNKEYDKLYDELKMLEEATGIILAGSVTQKAGYEVVSKLPKVKHPSKMLSLDKTKDRNALGDVLLGRDGMLSWKLDGLTVVATYENGKLVRAVTRGNGEIGEDITSNFKTFINIPLTINIKERLVIRGEAIISYKDFEVINDRLPADDRYKNPRNLCSGSVRQLDSKITAQRNVRYIPFAVVEGLDMYVNKSDKLNVLRTLGFEVVDFKIVNTNNVVKGVEYFENEVENYKYPTDGLVLTINDVAFSKSLGSTSKHPKDGIAFKWGDEVAETTLLGIEWSTSRTGAINPIAVFEPVELEGTTVERASVHNVSIMEELQLGIGDKITVYKANMIIPQVDENLTKSGTCRVPDVCPVCGGNAEVRQEKLAKTLYCTNPACSAQLVRFLSHFVSRDAMNIDGISESTLDKFIDLGLIKHAGDIFRLEDYEETITSLEGFGQKSFDKMVNAIGDACHEVDMAKFIYALGIPNVGKSTAKDLVRHFDYDLDELINADEDDLMEIDGIGGVVASDIVQYFGIDKNIEIIEDILEYIDFAEPEEVDTSSSIAGLTFVVTGKVYQFANRKELEAKIESLGGKLASSVSSKTDYLINNDVTSTSGKNKKAHDLGIPIISEDDFLRMI